MIPVSTLYGEYIDRPKLTEQKNPFEYIVPPPSRGSEQLSTFSSEILRKRKGSHHDSTVQPAREANPKRH